MEEMVHHLGCVKACKQWDKLHINWCRISSISSMFWSIVPEKINYLEKTKKSDSMFELTQFVLVNSIFVLNAAQFVKRSVSG